MIHAGWLKEGIVVTGENVDTFNIRLLRKAACLQYNQQYVAAFLPTFSTRFSSQRWCCCHSCYRTCLNFIARHFPLVPGTCLVPLNKATVTALRFAGAVLYGAVQLHYAGSARTLRTRSRKLTLLAGCTNCSGRGWSACHLYLTLGRSDR